MDAVNIIVIVDGVPSMPYVLDLKDRQGPFTEYEGDEFALYDTPLPAGQSYPPYEITCTNNSSDLYAIHKVILTPTKCGNPNDTNNPPCSQSGIPYEANLDVVLNGNLTKVLRVDSNIGAPGIILDEESCKSIAALGATQATQQNNPISQLTLYHYSNSDTPNSENYDNIGSVFKVAFTKDGSVSVSLFLGTQSSQARGRVHDLRNNNSIVNNFLTCNSSCDYSITLEIGRIVKVLLKGSLDFEVSL